jgi:hypothetical protein
MTFDKNNVNFLILIKCFVEYLIFNVGLNNYVSNMD